MLCDDCKKRPASVHITKIYNDDKSETRLCGECAKKYQKEIGFNFDIDANFSFHKFLTGLLEADTMESNLGKDLQVYPECDECGFNYMQFQQNGRLGCAKCYETFSTKLNVLLKRVHGSNVHTGKFPKRSGASLRAMQEIKLLRNQLQKHVLEEEFEKAAELRDKIKDLEKNIEPKGEI